LLVTFDNSFSNLPLRGKHPAQLIPSPTNSARRAVRVDSHSDPHFASRDLRSRLRRKSRRYLSVLCALPLCPLCRFWLLASASAFPSFSANLSALRVSALSFSVRRTATTAAERHEEQSPSNLPKNQLTLRTTGILACRSTCATSVSRNREASYSNERCFLSSSTRNFRNP
jgi:hypothetical protein